MYGLRLLSETIPKVTGTVCSRKYIMLGRLVTHWREIVGDELALKTQPVKIRYMKSKNQKTKATASLDIATPSAEATVLHYQKDLILERINRIFGDRWVTSLRFVPLASNAPSPGLAVPRRKIPLSEAEKQRLLGALEEVSDPDLMKKLEKLGAAILQDRAS